MDSIVLVRWGLPVLGLASKEKVEQWVPISHLKWNCSKSVHFLSHVDSGRSEPRWPHPSHDGFPQSSLARLVQSLLRPLCVHQLDYLRGGNFVSMIQRAGMDLRVSYKVVGWSLRPFQPAWEPISHVGTFFCLFAKTNYINTSQEGTIVLTKVMRPPHTPSWKEDFIVQSTNIPSFRTYRG